MHIFKVRVADLLARDFHQGRPGAIQGALIRDCDIVTQYSHEFDQLPPIVVHNGEVLDGLHRCAAAVLLGHEWIDAVEG